MAKSTSVSSNPDDVFYSIVRTIVLPKCLGFVISIILIDSSHNWVNTRVEICQLVTS